MSIATHSASHSYLDGFEVPDPLGVRVGKALVIVAFHAAVAAIAWGIGGDEVVRDLGRTIEVRLVESPPPRPMMPAPRVVEPAPRPVAERIRPAPVAEPVLATTARSEAAPAVAVAPPMPPAPVAAAKSETSAPPVVVDARFDAAYLNNPRPAYPPLSRRLGEEGRVLLRVQVTPEGQACKVEVRQSSGFPRLDQAALDAVGRWRFVPARRGDEAIASWVTVPINFTLEG